MFTVAQIKEHLIGMSHGGTLNKVRNIEVMFERATSVFLLKCKPLDVMRVSSLANTVHDDFQIYSLPDDFGSIIDLYPQADRELWDKSFRIQAGPFDQRKAIQNRTISIEGLNGSKIIKINWKSRQGKTLHNMDSVTANGTWAASGTSSDIVADSLIKYSGQSSISFDLAATGDGIQNTSMTAVDMTSEDEVADVFVPFYVKNAADLAKITSVTGVWGNDVSTKYWTGVAQTTQYDGSAFKVGWNVVKFPWSTATETGTVVPTAIDAFKLTFATTGAITNLRVDNIIFSIGRNFDIKYYSKYLIKNSAGTWISRTTSDDDTVVLDNDSLPLFLFELLQEMAHQTEGSDSSFDMDFALMRLKELFPAYKGLNPSQSTKVQQQYGSRRPSRGRW